MLQQPLSQRAITLGAHHAAQPQAGRDHQGRPQPSNPAPSFDPNFVRLDMLQLQRALRYHGFMDRLALPARTIPPGGDRAFIQPVCFDNRLDRTAIRQQRHHTHHQRRIGSQARKQRAGPFAKRFLATGTLVPAAFSTVDHNIPRAALTPCAAVQVRAELVVRVHRFGLCPSKPSLPDEPFYFKLSPPSTN